MSSNRISSLDGLRAVSILMVLCAHLADGTGRPWIYLSALGHYGVETFFVISGFLITLLLLEEKEATGAISMRNFYARRTLRIFPIAYVFIATVWILSRAGVVTVHRPSGFLFAVTYLSNYNANSEWPLGHLWSLAVEEQFYLLWPATLVLLGTIRARHAALFLIALAPALRFIVELRYPGALANSAGAYFPLVADSIAIGCVAAFHRKRWLEQLAGKRFHWLVPVAAFFSIYFPFHARAVRVPFEALHHSIFSAGAAYTMLWLIANAESAGAALLNNRVMAYIGTISYSVYIWQQLFTAKSQPTLLGVTARLVATFTVAIAAHYLVERPFLKLKKRFTPQRSAAASAA